MKISAIVVIAASIVALGCSADRGANPAYGCTSDADCDAGVCYRGFCIAGDGGQRDAGPACAMTCYDGPEGTLGMGVCHSGCAEPTDGGSICRGELVPTDELCNGVDDDCNGMIDEMFPLDTTDQCGSCATQCAVGEDCCEASGGGHECANLASSADHCGDCGTRCDAGQACCGGEGCVDVSSDVSNCGRCGNACGAGQLCCGGTCVNPRSSNEHCNACGNACLGTDASMCCPAAADGTVDCHPLTECATCTDCGDVNDLCCGGECIDRSSDNLNCGACGVACGADERCCDGACVSTHDACSGCGDTCSGSELCCGAACVSSADMNNCAGCGVMCAAGQTCCSTGCANLTTDNANCGACGNACVGQLCSNGHCCDAGTTWCENAGACVSLNTEAHCGSCENDCNSGCSCIASGGRYVCFNLLLGLGC